MNLVQLMSTVVSSETKDWHHIPCWGHGSGPSYRDHFAFYEVYNGQPNILHVTTHSNVAVYMPDISITLAFGLPSIENFEEEWTKQFPNPKASVSYADVFYSGSLVFRGEYVNVDGGTKLPLPGGRDKRDVPKAHAQFVRLLDSFERQPNFDSDFQRAGMVLTNALWPEFGTGAKRED